MKYCRHCGKAFTKKELEQKKNQKSDRIKAAMADAKARGEQVGAIKKRDDNKIRALRSQGLTMREIALALGVSTMPVQAALKGFK